MLVGDVPRYANGVPTKSGISLGKNIVLISYFDDADILSGISPSGIVIGAARLSKKREVLNIESFGDVSWFKEAVYEYAKSS